METKTVSKRELLLNSPVRLVTKTNPKKPNSMSHERFENYFTLDENATVRDALKAGVRMDDIRHDTDHGFIVVGKEAIEALAVKAEEDRKAQIEAARALLAEVDAPKKK